jgi:hypothetical protein
MQSLLAWNASLAALLAGAWLAGCEIMPYGTSGKVVVRDRDTTVAVVFSNRDREIIADYYSGRKKNLPPGLAKKKRLPPGLEKQVRRNGELPPGLQREALPPDLERRLPKLPDDYVRIIVGTDIVLQNTRTKVVVDIIKNIAY